MKNIVVFVCLLLLVSACFDIEKEDDSKKYGTCESEIYKAVAEKYNKKCEHLTKWDIERVTTLDLSKRHLGELHKGDFSNFSGLAEINLEMNGIQSIPDGVFDGTSLKYINLQANHIETISENAFKGINPFSIQLAFNRIKTLPTGLFRTMPDLRYLDIGVNYISELSDEIFVGLQSLEQLFLNGNKLSSLNENLFNDLTSLDNLNLAGNELSDLPGNIFGGLLKLSKLKLYWNKFQSLPDEIFNAVGDPRGCEVYLWSGNEFSDEEVWKIRDNAPDNITFIN